jgi:hypothetical protein
MKVNKSPMDKNRLGSKKPRLPALISWVGNWGKAARRTAYLSKNPEVRLLEDAEVANRLIRERIAQKQRA